jgi:hypothetical protein
MLNLRIGNRLTRNFGAAIPHRPPGDRRPQPASVRELRGRRPLPAAGGVAAYLATRGWGYDGGSVGQVSVQLPPISEVSNRGDRGVGVLASAPWRRRPGLGLLDHPAEDRLPASPAGRSSSR